MPRRRAVLDDDEAEAEDDQQEEQEDEDASSDDDDEDDDYGDGDSEDDRPRQQQDEESSSSSSGGLEWNGEDDDGDGDGDGDVRMGGRAAGAPQPRRRPVRAAAAAAATAVAAASQRGAKGKARRRGSSSDSDASEQVASRSSKVRRQTRNRVQQQSYAESEQSEDGGPQDESEWIYQYFVIEEILDHRTVWRPQQHLDARHEGGVLGMVNSTCQACVEAGLPSDGKQAAGCVAITEYLVRWHACSYLWCTWEMGPTLRQAAYRGRHLSGATKLHNYVDKAQHSLQERRRLPPDELDQDDRKVLQAREAQYRKLVLERIVNRRDEQDSQQHPFMNVATGEEPTDDDEFAFEPGTRIPLWVPMSQFLCKWQGVEYADATWENYEMLKLMLPEQQSAIGVKIRQFYTRSPATPVEDSQSANTDRSAYKVVEFPFLQGKSDLELHPYQDQGIRWIFSSWQKRTSAILADEMGLGKTVQCVCFLSLLNGFPVNMPGPFLVVVPLSTLEAWTREFAKWAPDMNVVVYVGSSKSRALIRSMEFYPKGRGKSDQTAFSVLLTTYEHVVRDANELKAIPWRVLAVDEAHRLRNVASKAHQRLLTLSVDFKLLLTGTPLQNSLQELWGLLHFLDPVSFSSGEKFQELYGALASNSAPAEDVRQAQADLKSTLDNYMLRRTKADIVSPLPPKERKLLTVDPMPTQLKYYRWLWSRDARSLATGENRHVSFQNLAQQLQKCCNHPFLIAGARSVLEARTASSADPLARFTRFSGKMLLLDRLLTRLLAESHRVLIFSQMVLMLDIMEEYLVARRIKFARIDGGTPGPVRQLAMDRFNAPDSDEMVFLLSTRAGGVGITLTGADTVIIYDSDWNPQNDVQAEARAHRLGQKKRVTVYRFVTRRTIEERIMASARKKLALGQLAMQTNDEGDMESASPDAPQNDLIDDSEILKDAQLTQSSQSSEDDDAVIRRFNLDKLLNEAQILDTESYDQKTEDDGVESLDSLLSGFRSSSLKSKSGAKNGGSAAAAVGSPPALDASMLAKMPVAADSDMVEQGPSAAQITLPKRHTESNVLAELCDPDVIPAASDSGSSLPSISWFEEKLMHGGATRSFDVSSKLITTVTDADAAKFGWEISPSVANAARKYDSDDVVRKAAQVLGVALWVTCKQSLPPNMPNVTDLSIDADTGTCRVSIDGHELDASALVRRVAQLDGLRRCFKAWTGQQTFKGFDDHATRSKFREEFKRNVKIKPATVDGWTADLDAELVLYMMEYNLSSWETIVDEVGSHHPRARSIRGKFVRQRAEKLLNRISFVEDALRQVRPRAKPAAASTSAAYSVATEESRRELAAKILHAAPALSELRRLASSTTTNTPNVTMARALLPLISLHQFIRTLDVSKWRTKLQFPGSLQELAALLQGVLWDYVATEAGARLSGTQLQSLASSVARVVEPPTAPPAPVVRSESGVLLSQHNQLLQARVEKLEREKHSKSNGATNGSKHR